MKDVRLHARGGDHGVPIGYTPPRESRRWWHVDLHQILTMLGSVILAAATALGGWFTLRAEVREHERAIERMQAEDRERDTRDAGRAVDVGKLGEKIEGVIQRLDDVKRAVDRIDDRTARTEPRR